MKPKFCIVFSVLFALQFSWAEWRMTADVGTGNSYLTAMETGKGRGDDTNRLYVGSDSITEYSYTSDGWVVDTIAFHTRFNYALRIADAGNDDTLRLYGANALSHVYEYTYYPPTFIAEDRNRIPQKGTNPEQTGFGQIAAADKKTAKNCVIYFLLKF